MAVFGSFRQWLVDPAARLRSGLSGAAIASFGLICAGIPATKAANFACSWNDATANWTTVADWSNCNSAFPNNSGGNTYDATIAQGNPTLTTTITIGSVAITSAGMWSLAGTGTATLTGDATNAGVLDVDVNGDGGGNLTITGTLANSKTV
jgi:hypothetical protein